MSHVPTIAPSERLIRDVIDGHGAYRALGCRARPRDARTATAAILRMATGRAPGALRRHLRIKGLHYARWDAMKALGHPLAADMEIAPTAAATLERLGLNTAAIGVLAFVNGTPAMEIDVGGTPLIAVIRVPDRGEGPLRLDVELVLSPGIRWLPSIGLMEIGRKVPETLLSSMDGRPLAQMVSHPVTDALGLTIETAFDDDGTTTVHTPRDGRWLRLGDTGQQENAP